jgi:hydroxymethylpyrimidine pyrophosphatase-like HAD family hydrolase
VAEYRKKSTCKGSDNQSRNNSQKRKNYGFEKVVAFGDNLNDLPLFEASDEAYAVENAKEDVKKHATAVIGRNTEDAVAEFLNNI